MGLLDHLAPRRSDTEARAPAADAADPIFPTKALRKFIAALTSRGSPVLLDLGPVIGANISFFGEELGCKIIVENVYEDLDRHVRDDRLEVLPEFLSRRFPQRSASVSGILCWDVMDYLDRPSAQALVDQLTRVLRPDGALLGLFGTAQPSGSSYTKYLIVDEEGMRHRPYAAARGRQPALLNRDIIRLFGGLNLVDSFLLKNNLREILFRKPTA